LDKVKIYIESKHIPLTEVRPIWEDAFSKERDNKSVHYVHEIDNKIIFHTSEDYKLLYGSKGDECAEIKIHFKELTNGEYVNYWTGFFKIFDTDIDEDHKKIEVKPDPLDPYKCLSENGKIEVNVFASGPRVQTSRLGLSAKYETIEFSNISANELDGNQLFPNRVETPVFDENFDGEKDFWCLKSHTSNFITLRDEDLSTGNTIASGYNFRSIWHRETTDENCTNGQPTGPTLSSGWSLLKDECSTKSKATWWRCPISTGLTFTGTYTNGRKLSDFIRNVLILSGCDVFVKSTFFGIGDAQNDSPDNRAYTFAAENLQDLTIHQKSDIKRPDGLPLSTAASWVLKPIEFLNDLIELFNVRYLISDGVFILEHVSFFESIGIRDLTNTRIPNRYSFKGADDLRTEEYKYSDDRTSELFKANLIKYDCGTEEKTIRLNLINCDLINIADPAKAEVVDDSGFVILTNGLSEGDRVVIDNNLPLSWPVLQNHLHRHDRAYPVGELNGQAVVFDSFRPYRKGEKFTLKNCKNDRVDPHNKIRTSLGDGEVSKLTEHIMNGNTELEINY